MHDFVRQMIRVRKANAHAFAPLTYGGGAPFSWRNASNTGEPDWGSRNMMQEYYDPAAGPEVAVLINLERNWTTFTLPEGRNWKRVIDTQSHFDLPAFLTESGNDVRKSANANVDNPQGVAATYDVAENAIVVLVAE
jgi:hypothetical protein